MATQYSSALRTAQLEAIRTVLGSPFQIQLLGGAIPADVATAASGTLVATFASATLAAASGGSIGLTGTPSTTCSAGNDGSLGYFRALTSGGTAHLQGLAGMARSLSTSAATAAGGSVLTFASAINTAQIAVGMAVSGTGVPSGARIATISGSTITLSAPSTAGIASGASITLSPDMVLDNFNLVATQTVQIASLTITASNA